MARFVKGVEFTTTTPGSTNHTPFLIKFNYLLHIEFYKEGSIVHMSIEKWRYNICDFVYNWSFSLNLEDLHNFISLVKKNIILLVRIRRYVEAQLANNKYMISGIGNYMIVKQ